MEDQQDHWDQFLKRSFQVLHTSLNLSDVLLMHLYSEAVLTQDEFQKLTSENTKIARALKFITIISSDATRINLRKIYAILAKYKRSAAAQLFKQHAESVGIDTSGWSSMRYKIPDKLPQPKQRRLWIGLSCSMLLNSILLSILYSHYSLWEYCKVPTALNHYGQHRKDQALESHCQPSMHFHQFQPAAPATLPGTSEYTKPAILDPEKPFEELLAIAHSNHTAIGDALPRIISQRYSSGKMSILDTLFSFLADLPTLEQQIIGFSAINDELKRYSPLPDVAKMVKLAKNVKRLNDAIRTTLEEVSPTSRSRLAALFQESSPLSLIGEKAECYLNNVAYQWSLTAGDYGRPQTIYVFTSTKNKRSLRIYPKVRGNRIVFNVLERNYPLYASDSNPNMDGRNKMYETKGSERYVLKEVPQYLPVNAEVDWKLVYIYSEVENTFKILSAKSDDFMFVHKSETSNTGLHRVLLGRKAHSHYDHGPKADLWTLECKPGYYDVPS